MQSVVAVVWTLVAWGACLSSVYATPLDDYVMKEDPTYRWYDTGKRLTGPLPWEKWDGYVLNLTSQTWLTSNDSDCSVWTHDLVIVKPCNYDNKKTAFLIIGDGENHGPGPSASDEQLIFAATVAVKTGALAAVIYQVPNQPCTFTSDCSGRPRSEDELVAYAWSYFLDHTDKAEWPLRLPMTKAVVRGMDAVQGYAKDYLKIRIDNFVVAGASKRGWSTWTTAVVDTRVIGIVPIVMDLLNVATNLHHYYQALGGWPVAFKAYYDLNITLRLDTPEFKELTDIVDPYVYRDRLVIPKLMVTASNDEFFLIDDSAYFWEYLPGEKHCLILANTEHSLSTGFLKLLVGTEAFFLSLAESYELGLNPGKLSLPGSAVEGYKVGTRPTYWYNLKRDAGIIEIGTKDKPLDVRVWSTYTLKGTKGRDFRWFTNDDGNCPTMVVDNVCIKPVYFKSHALKATDLSNEDGLLNYYASLKIPQEGYGAFFVEMRFPGPRAHMPFVITTPALVIPNYFPYGGCGGTDCKGKLV